MTSPAPGAAEFVRFVHALDGAASFLELDRAFLRGFGQLLQAPMFGYNVSGVGDAREHALCVNVSDVFRARCAAEPELDVLRSESRRTGLPVYNLALMPAPEWEQSESYRRLFGMHRMRHALEVPVASGGELVGALHFASDAPDRDVAADDVARARAIGEVLGAAIARIRGGRGMRHELGAARTAIELAGTAVVVSRRGATELAPNTPARRLIAEIAEGEQELHRVLAPPPADSGGFSRRADVVLACGRTAALHAHSGRSPDGDLVTVLELQREHERVAPAPLAALSPREAEIAALVAEGMSDREIATRLHLSAHTVSQHVKRIYRKLDVDSRVRLTRLLLGAGRTSR